MTDRTPQYGTTAYGKRTRPKGPEGVFMRRLMTLKRHQPAEIVAKLRGGGVALVLLLTLALNIAGSSEACADEAGVAPPSEAVTEELRAELRRYAAWFWVQQDLPPELRDVEFEWHIQRPSGDINPFGEALTLFSNIYSDRLRPLDPVAPYSLLDLLSDDPQVMAKFRLYTSTGLLDTTIDDGDVHCKHWEALVEALLAPAGEPQAGLVEEAIVSDDGESIATVGLLVGMMPPIDNPFSFPPPSSIPNLPAEIQDVDRKMKEAEEIWRLWLKELEERVPPFVLYQEDSWSDGDVSGFDCDDFAEMLGRFLRWYVRQHAASHPFLEPRILQMAKGGLSRSGHAVTLIFLRDYYWIIDPQTGIRSGPFHRYFTWPPDLRDIANHYWGAPNYRFGIPVDYPVYVRPWYEDEPWYSDPVQRARILPELPSDIPPDSVLP